MRESERDLLSEESGMREKDEIVGERKKGRKRNPSSSFSCLDHHFAASMIFTGKGFLSPFLSPVEKEKESEIRERERERK